jgi:CO/xanthine dehydrogenase Mo-binding subunit
MIALPRSLADNPRLDQWVGFEPDRTVRLATGKVELGQGVLTALVQIAAEELDLDPSRVRIASGDTGRTPNEGYTTGSLSIEVSGGSIRLVCAEVRRLFVQKLAAELRCDPAELAVVDGRFLRGQSDSGYDYWRLAPDIDLARDATGNAPVKHPSEHHVIGRNLPRVDLPEKLAGAPFLHDLSPQRVLHARVLRQPRRGARFVRLDEAAVRRAGAVEIMREGDFVAFVAERESVARAALEAARQTAQWEGGVDAPDDAGTPQNLLVLASNDREIEVSAQAVPAPARTIEVIYSRPYLAHASLAPSCAVAQFIDGRLEVTTHAQGVYPLRIALAHALPLEIERISVRHHQGAGCYGHNGADDVAFDAAAIAVRAPGRAVRVQWERDDELAAAPFGAAMAVKIRAGLDAAGRPLDWTLEVFSPVHTQRPGMSKAPLLGREALPDPPPRPEPADPPDAAGGGGTRNAVAIYQFPRHKVIHHFIPDPRVRTSALRSLGAFANVFAIECFLDELAELAGEDPVAYRLALLPDPRARHVIETVAAMCDWTARLRGLERGGGRGIGLGMARYKNRGGYAAVVAEVEVEAEVRLTKLWCAADGGLIINPDGALNQVEGGIIQAASWTLKEQVRFAEGRVASTDWDTYPILKFSEVPEIDIHLIDARSEPPLGLGEVAHGPTAAAIGNAVARALGARIRDLPLTRERIAAALLGS